MICKEIKTGLYFNYKFKNKNKVILSDNKDSFIISYDQWCKQYYIIDKWKNLSPYDIKYNDELKNNIKIY